VLDPTVPPADAQVNQYTITPPDGQRRYDRNGNLLRSREGAADELNVEFDYANRMTTRADAATGQLERYFYDSLGRRIARVLDAGGTPQFTVYYYDALGRVVEERDGSEVVQATYLYGHGPDQPLNMQRGGLDFFYHSDDLHNVMSLTDAAGVVIERYEYGDYGTPLDPTTLAPLVGPVSGVGNPLLFSGARHDSESGLYCLSTRYLDPTVGRFTSRDSIGTWGDPLGLGNPFTYVGNNPWTLRDPRGTGPGMITGLTALGTSLDPRRWAQDWIHVPTVMAAIAIPNLINAMKGANESNSAPDKSTPGILRALTAGMHKPKGGLYIPTSTRAIAIPNLIEARKGANESNSAPDKSSPSILRALTAGMHKPKGGLYIPTSARAIAIPNLIEARKGAN